jgi:TonB family protein
MAHSRRTAQFVAIALIVLAGTSRVSSRGDSGAKAREAVSANQDRSNSGSSDSAHADFGSTVEVLTPTQGIDFSTYLKQLVTSVKRNWYAIMPESASKGEQGKVVVRFHIRRDGKLPIGDPIIETASGKAPFDRAALGAIRGSAPFQHLPVAFGGPSIELRFTFLYNLPVKPAQQ